MELGKRCYQAMPGSGAAGLPPPEQYLARAVAKELDLGQLPVGELGGDGELRRRGGPIDVAGIRSGAYS